MNNTTKSFKEKIQKEKRNIPALFTTNFDNTTRTLSIATTPTSIIKIVISIGISPYDVTEQIKDLIRTGFNLTKKKISLSNFTDCYYDLLFTKEEIKYNDNNTKILESYFCTV